MVALCALVPDADVPAVEAALTSATGEPWGGVLVASETYDARGAVVPGPHPGYHRLASEWPDAEATTIRATIARVSPGAVLDDTPTDDVSESLVRLYQRVRSTT